MYNQYKEFMIERMKTLKLLCDVGDFHRVMEVTGNTIQEMRGIYDLNFNHNKMMFLVNLIRIYAERLMWADAIITIGKINVEIKMVELVMGRRMRSSDRQVGELSALPMDIRERIASLLI